MQQILITRPDDWHIHLRDGDALQYTVPHAAHAFKRAIVMPNLKPSIKTVEDAFNYRTRILEHLPKNSDFEPLMTLYLTQNTSKEDILRAKESGFIYGFKLYPAGATTNSSEGVSSLDALSDTFEMMENLGLPLLVHGEVIDQSTDIFDREALFIEQQLKPLINSFPKLKVVMEHITTKDAVDFILTAPDTVAATITPQHLLYNRNAILVGGIKPHYYCLPILKREIHRQALLNAVASGNPKFFIGTDSAPHAKSTKENHCGCAGCYSATTALSLYIKAFESVNALDKIEGFLSHHGPDFYGLPRNTDRITLTKQSWTVPKQYPYLNSDFLTPLGAEETLEWSVVITK